MGRLRSEKVIQEDFFGDWKKAEHLLDLDDKEEALKMMYNKYQKAMRTVTQIQKKRVMREELDYLIAMVVVGVAKEIAITHSVYMKIINMCKIGKNFNVETVISVVVKDRNKELARKLKSGNARRRIKIG